MSLKTKFMYSGTSVDVIQYNEEAATDELRPGVYSVQFHMMKGYYLSIVSDKFELPPTLFGNVHARIDKCLRAYQDREGSTGVLMTGDKGTGKTLLMSALANAAIDRLNLPVIMVRGEHLGEAFESFISQLGECVVLFDEFGKHYAKDKQALMLSYFDGIDKTKRLNIVTENAMASLNDFILDRPGRALYHFKYRKLDEPSVVGYCQQMKFPEERLEELLSIYRRARSFSFDMLQNIVAEVERSGEPVKAALADMNIDIWMEPDYMKLVEVSRVPDYELSDSDFCRFTPIEGREVITVPDDDSYQTYTNVTFLGERSEEFEKQVRLGMSSKSEGKPVLEADIQQHMVRKHSVTIQEGDLVYTDTEKAVYEDEGFVMVFQRGVKPPPVGSYSSSMYY